MLIIASCVEWLIWMLRIQIKNLLNLILGFNYSKRLLNLKKCCVINNQFCKGLKNKIFNK